MLLLNTHRTTFLMRFISNSSSNWLKCVILCLTISLTQTFKNDLLLSYSNMRCWKYSFTHLRDSPHPPLKSSTIRAIKLSISINFPPFFLFL